MNARVFDPMQFIDMETTEASTKRPPLAEGDYPAMVGEVTCVPWQGKTDPTKSGLRLVVPLTVTITAEEKDRLGVTIDTIKLTDSVMLDTTEGGLLDFAPGKNSGLRRYREALNMNEKGTPFSPRRMQGQPLLVKIKHELYNDEIMEKVGGVARIS